LKLTKSPKTIGFPGWPNQQRIVHLCNYARLFRKMVLFYFIFTKAHKWPAIFHFISEKQKHDFELKFFFHSHFYKCWMLTLFYFKRMYSVNTYIQTDKNGILFSKYWNSSIKSNKNEVWTHMYTIHHGCMSSDWIVNPVFTDHSECIRLESPCL
jgi:hypothetical protein